MERESFKVVGGLQCASYDQPRCCRRPKAETVREKKRHDIKKSLPSAFTSASASLDLNVVSLQPSIVKMVSYSSFRSIHILLLHHHCTSRPQSLPGGVEEAQKSSLLSRGGRRCWMRGHGSSGGGSGLKGGYEDVCRVDGEQLESVQPTWRQGEVLPKSGKSAGRLHELPGAVGCRSFGAHYPCGPFCVAAAGGTAVLQPQPPPPPSTSRLRASC